MSKRYNRVMNTSSLHVLYEDNHLLVVNKPAGVVTQGANPETPSLFHMAAQYIKHKYNKPGNVYLGITSRLDAPTTGVVAIARTSKAAGRLMIQFRDREVEKTYWAVVAGRLAPSSGEWTDYLAPDKRHRSVNVARPTDPEATEARLRYRVLEQLADRALVEVQLLTGRKHQIRVQFAHRGHPVWGDIKYGGPGGFTPGIALHARRLKFTHPVRQEPVEVTAPLPRSWQRLGLGGKWTG